MSIRLTFSTKYVKYKEKDTILCTEKESSEIHSVEIGLFAMHY